MTTAARTAGGAGGNPHEALLHLAALPKHDPTRPAVRDRAIVAWLPLANDLAHRFAGRGEPLADLLQTATVGLIKAVDRFDVDRGTDFPAFAVPTIVGEVKRYFRDQTWDLHVPRRLQELRRAISQSTELLCQQLGRTPTTAEIAADLGLSEPEIRDGLRVSGAYSTISLDAPAAPGGDEPTATLGELIGTEDAELSRAELRMAVAPAVANLSERQQRILHMRFFGNLTQDQIARQIGISQMHVSRLLTRILADLRERLREPEPAGRPYPGSAPASRPHAGPTPARSSVRSPARSAVRRRVG